MKENVIDSEFTFQKDYINLDKKLVLEYWWFWNENS